MQAEKVSRARVRRAADVGGRVWAEAAPDEGATFFFTLEGENEFAY